MGSSQLMGTTTRATWPVYSQECGSTPHRYRLAVTTTLSGTLRSLISWCVMWERTCRSRTLCLLAIVRQHLRTGMISTAVTAKPLQTRGSASSWATAPAVMVSKLKMHAVNAVVGSLARQRSYVHTLQSLLVAPMAKAFASAKAVQAFATKMAVGVVSLVTDTCFKRVRAHMWNAALHMGRELALLEGTRAATSWVNADVLMTKSATLALRQLLDVLVRMAPQS
mmetsp:Transcript_39320/g.71559  ORF Transcript_39320/g.71559 Transcript_39320/m.71559 type:complete len:224 (+) Transcript_39320:556-1227(+)